MAITVRPRVQRFYPCAERLTHVLGYVNERAVDPVTGRVFTEGEVRRYKAKIEQFGCEVFVHDPEADPDETLHEYGIRLRSWDELPPADCAILAVAHRSFLERPTADFLSKIVRQGCLVQVKPALDTEPFRREGVRAWRL